MEATVRLGMEHAVFDGVCRHADGIDQAHHIEQLGHLSNELLKMSFLIRRPVLHEASSNCDLANIVYLNPMSCAAS